MNKYLRRGPDDPEIVTVVLDWGVSQGARPRGYALGLQPRNAGFPGVEQWHAAGAPAHGWQMAVLTSLCLHSPQPSHVGRHCCNGPGALREARTNALQQPR